MTAQEIDRIQAAIDAIKTSRYLVDAMEKIIRLPSAQPEREKKREKTRKSEILRKYMSYDTINVR